MKSLDQLIQWRRYLHPIPEFGFEEVTTSAYATEPGARASRRLS